MPLKIHVKTADRRLLSLAYDSGFAPSLRRAMVGRAVALSRRFIADNCSALVRQFPLRRIADFLRRLQHICVVDAGFLNLKIDKPQEN